LLKMVEFKALDLIKFTAWTKRGMICFQSDGKDLAANTCRWNA
jgi:hypothetical protein